MGNVHFMTRKHSSTRANIRSVLAHLALPFNTLHQSVGKLACYNLPCEIFET